MAERTYLTTTFKEKDKVKALGARWDRETGQWYVPAGLDLAPFEAWLPATAADVELPGLPHSEPPSASRELDTKVKGVPLSRLLGGVAAAVSRAFSEGVWTTAEVLRASSGKGHYYLELTERNDAGDVLAQARAVIWARQAQTLLAEFKRATGADLDAGIKVLLRAKPVFKAQFGFSLEVDAIDPSYTLGDLEARKREIRERLKREGLFDRNRRLPAPWDFTTVLVVAPERAAGLGDFAKEAQRLESHGVCQFSYAYSRFQGEGAAAEVMRAIKVGLRTWSGPTLPDAVIIIRGGGSVNDLAWLNDYALARCICECPIPVFTGIGHERDDTSIDEVANRKFDTPSKVISGMEDVVQARVREARSCYEAVLARSRSDLARATNDAFTVRKEIETAARGSIVQARSAASELFTSVRLDAASTLHNARTQSAEAFHGLRNEARAQVASARQFLPAVLSRIAMDAVNTVRSARQDVESRLPYVLERAEGVARATRLQVLRAIADTFDRAQRSASHASHRAQALFREIAGQGPEKTIRRGFAVVRSSEGKTITAAEAVKDGAGIEVRLRDGVIGATVVEVKKSSPEGR